MGKAPRVNASEVIKILEQLGFSMARSSGSHRVYRHVDGRRTVVSFHGSDILHPKVLGSILKDIEVTVDEFERLLRKG